MGDQDDRAVEVLEGFFELFDGRQIEVVGGLVEDEGVDAARLEQGEGGAGAFAGGEGGGGAGDVGRAQPELGQQRAGLGR